MKQSAGFSGPRRPWAGSVRDFVLGTRVITGQGKQLRFGGEVTWNDHERILDAIEHRDAECAEILMRRHIARLRIESFAELQRLGADPAGTA